VCVSLETFDFLAILAVLGTVFASVVYGINRHNPNKKAKKSADDGVSDMYGVYSEQVKDILKLKDNHIKRLNAELATYSTEPEEEEGKQEIKLDDLTQIAKEAGINPIILNNPLVKKYIKKYTKGMDIEEIMALVSQFKGFMGSKGSKSETTDTQDLTAKYF